MWSALEEWLIYSEDIQSIVQIIVTRASLLGRKVEVIVILLLHMERTRNNYLRSFLRLAYLNLHMHY
jgi:hypothetical protein